MGSFRDQEGVRGNIANNEKFIAKCSRLPAAEPSPLSLPVAVWHLIEL
jgi:hypothetical protein